MPTVSCAGCGRKISLSFEELRIRIECKKCGRGFRPVGDDPALEPTPGTFADSRQDVGQGHPTEDYPAPPSSKMPALIAGIIAVGLMFVICSGALLFSGKKDQSASRTESGAGGLVTVQGSGTTKVVVKESKMLGLIYYDIIGQPQSGGRPTLVVYLGIQNHSETRKIDYTGWAYKHAGVKLWDDFGNSYGLMDYGNGARVYDGQHFQVDEHAIHPGIVITDFLAFERPIKKAKILHLELPGRNCGLSGKLRFTFHAPTQDGVP